MGIRGFTFGDSIHYGAVCDGCGAESKSEATSSLTMANIIKRCGWVRVAYDQQLKHYLWHCRKCKDKE